MMFNGRDRVPNGTMRPLRDGVMSVVNILTVGCPAATASAIWSGTVCSNAPCTIVWKD